MRWAKIIVGLLIAFAVAAFAVQNSARTTELSFDVAVAAWKLSRPISVPALMALCAGGGALVAWALGLASRVRLQRRVRMLEQESALRGAPPPADAGGGWA